MQGEAVGGWNETNYRKEAERGKKGRRMKRKT